MLLYRSPKSRHFALSSSCVLALFSVSMGVSCPLILARHLIESPTLLLTRSSLVLDTIAGKVGYHVVGVNSLLSFHLAIPTRQLLRDLLSSTMLTPSREVCSFPIILGSIFKNPSYRFSDFEFSSAALHRVIGCATALCAIVVHTVFGSATEWRNALSSQRLSNTLTFFSIGKHQEFVSVACVLNTVFSSVRCTMFS